MATRGWEQVTKADIDRKALGKAKPSKYRAQAVMIDGHRFDSKKEGARYLELKAMQAAGSIERLLLQPAFQLWAAFIWEPDQVTGHLYQAIEVGEYRADFSYVSNAGFIVEDVKSPATRTPLYRLKKKLAEACYGIRITEV